MYRRVTEVEYRSIKALTDAGVPYLRALADGSTNRSKSTYVLVANCPTYEEYRRQTTRPARSQGIRHAVTQALFDRIKQLQKHGMSVREAAEFVDLHSSSVQRIFTTSTLEEYHNLQRVYSERYQQRQLAKQQEWQPAMASTSSQAERVEWYTEVREYFRQDLAHADLAATERNMALKEQARQNLLLQHMVNALDGMAEQMKLLQAMYQQQGQLLLNLMAELERARTGAEDAKERERRRALYTAVTEPAEPD
jgi:hypothetical protein